MIDRQLLQGRFLPLSQYNGALHSELWRVDFAEVKKLQTRLPATLNGMAESFVKSMKCDYVSWIPKPDARTALLNLANAFDHFNESHPHSALKYRSPREFRQPANSPT